MEKYPLISQWEEKRQISNDLRTYEERKDDVGDYKKKRGYIYLLKSNGIYKIGRSLNIKSRIDLYRTENPFGIRLIFQKEVDDYVKVESILLEKFKENKVKGKEWFDLNLKDVRWIKQNI